MKTLPKYTLAYDHKHGGWKLERDKGHHIIRRFKTKEQATRRGVLKRAVGKAGGSVRIEKRWESGYEEERTFPPSADPHRSKG